MRDSCYSDGQGRFEHVDFVQLQPSQDAAHGGPAQAGGLRDRQSAAKWVRRFRDEGQSGLRDRSSRPHRSPRSTTVERMARVEQLRRERWTGVRDAGQLLNVEVQQVAGSGMFVAHDTWALDADPRPGYEPPAP